MQNSIGWLKTFDDLKDGRDLTFKVRLEMEKIEVVDNELLERLLFFRVFESITPPHLPFVAVVQFKF